MNKEEKEQINKEAELLILLDTVCPNCILCLGIKEKYVIVGKPFNGNFALSRIMDCNHIHIVIKEKGINSMSPKEVFKEFCDKGWLDDE